MAYLSRTWLTLGILLTVLAMPCIYGCGSARQAMPASQPAPASVATAVDGPPAFPGQPDSAPAPVAVQELRTASTTQFTQQGSAYSQQSAGSASYAPDASGAYVFSPALGSAQAGSAAQHQAWGLYRFDSLDTQRPVELDVDSTLASPAPGDPLAPLEYYVAVANYTRFAWDWFGPFKADAKLILNASAKPGQSEKSERYSSSAGSLYACVLVDSSRAVVDAQHPTGQVAARINGLTVTGTPSLITTKPLFLTPVGWKTGSNLRQPDTVKRASTLQPVQFPVINWTLQTENQLQFYQCQAQSVRVYRQGPADSVPLLVGEVAATQQQFTDPLDCADNIASATGGTTYRYLLQAVNLAGVTPPAPTAYFTVPMAAPEGLQATQDLPNGTGTQVSWLASDGALRYRIGRSLSADGSSAVEVGSVDAPALAYLDTTAPPGQYYWYFVRAEGQGDGNSANGLETGALSPLSAPAQGLRGYLLTLTCTTAGVGGNGSAGSPYALSSGQTYNFTVTDQTGGDLTNFCSYSVTPPASASFGAPAGTLSGIPPAAGAFSAAATFSFQSFHWTATAQCTGN